MRTAIVVISTGKYNAFIKPLFDSISEYWGHYDHDLFLFTDSPVEGVKCFQAENREWPFVTLMRFETLKPIYPYLKDYDFVMYLDADMEVVSKTFPLDGFELDKKFFGVSHPSNHFIGNFWPVETNPESLAHIDSKKWIYHQGCLWGTLAREFEGLNENIANAIRNDLGRNIVAVWHDESHLNRFFCDNKQFVHTLSPSFAHPEHWDMSLPKYIIHKDKSMVEYPRFQGASY